MIFRTLLTRKAAEVVDAVAEPARKAVSEHIENAKKVVGERSDWGAKVVKFGIGILMLLITFREDRNEVSAVKERFQALPSHITINNYVNERSTTRDDFRTEKDREG